MACCDKDVCICLLARDCENALLRNIRKVENISSNFKNAMIIVIENDSIDNTKKILYDWSKKNSKVTILSQDTNEITYPKKQIANNKNPGTSFYRINKMANFRNLYMNYIEDNKIKCDYLIVIDIDLDDFSDVNVSEVIDNAPSDWGGLFANGILYTKFFGKVILRKYYDNYAFLPIGSHKTSYTCKERHENVDIFRKVFCKQKYVEVRSAFGGIGIYKYELIKGLRYYCIPNTCNLEDEVLCEHISINLKLYEKAKLYVCRDLVSFYSKIKFCLFMLLSNKSFIRIYEVLKQRDFSWR